MEPPKKQIREYYDYHEVAKYVAKKLGIKDIRDVAGKFNEKAPDWESRPHQDFWHFITDNCEISNGCFFYLPDPDTADEEWQKPILDAFWEVLGPDSDGKLWVDW